MKRIIVAALLSIFVTDPVFAADNPTGSIGANISFDGVIGIQGEYSLESLIKQPVSVQVFWKEWSPYNDNWNVSALGIAGVYDFSKLVKLDRKIHTYVGAGLITVQNTWRGTGVPDAPPFGTELYLVGGVKYDLTPQFNIDGNLNTFGGLTVGINMTF